ncbi:MAG: GNAT family N-acetyltransferase [Xanthomonadaceae bacterium]|nr:GNAT family N-acetyltransferase [Xanthomonadaceae bacterium]
MDLRGAIPGDAGDVAALLTLLGYPCEHADAAERISTVLHNDRQALILARSRGVACGLLALDFMYYLPLGTTTCRVTALVVAEDTQGQGVGRLLLRDAERRARLGGAARLEVTSAGHRTDAHAFYRACGFTEGAVRFVKLLGD